MPQMIDWKTEIASRRKKLWEIIQRNKCDLGLVYSSSEHPQNFRYITNFVPTMGDMWALVNAEQQMECALTFHWELEQARLQSGIDDWYGDFEPLPVVKKRLEGHLPQRIAVVGMDRMPARAFGNLVNDFPNVSFVDVEDEYTCLRRKKSALELDLLREAVRITDGAMESLRDKLKAGMTEFDVSAELLYYFQKRGISRLAFSPLVMSGRHNPVMVRDTTDRRLEAGDAVLVDIGAEYEGYQADVSRTFVLGDPNEAQLRVWNTIEKAHQAVIALSRPETPCNALQTAADEIFNAAGLSLIHRIGHGIGMATSFEWPSLDTETQPLEPGMTIALEPGAYIEGAGSMKLEDSVLITDHGCELLSRCSREVKVPV